MAEVVEETDAAWIRCIPWGADPTGAIVTVGRVFDAAGLIVAALSVGIPGRKAGFGVISGAETARYIIGAVGDTSLGTGVKPCEATLFIGEASCC